MAPLSQEGVDGAEAPVGDGCDAAVEDFMRAIHIDSETAWNELHDFLLLAFPVNSNSSTQRTFSPEDLHWLYGEVLLKTPPLLDPRQVVTAIRCKKAAITDENIWAAVFDLAKKKAASTPSPPA